MNPAAHPTTALPHVGYVLTVYPRLSETFIINEIAALERMGLRITIFSQKPAAAESLAIASTRSPIVVLSDRGVRSWGAALRDHLTLLLTRPRRYLSLLRWATSRGHRSALKKFWRAGRLGRECERRGIDHLHAHFISGNTRLARLASAFAGTSYSLTAHAKDIYATGASDSKLARRIGEAEFTVTVSEHNRSYLTGFAGTEHLVVIRNGVDLEHIRFEPRRLADHRPVLAVGRLVPKKGFDVLIEALAQLPAEVEAWIAGEGPEETRLRALIASRGLESRVTLLGARSHAEVLELMTRSTALAVPSVVAGDGDRDGLPTVIAEAMAAGLPVVASRTTGIPELVIDGETGLLSDPGDATALARALAALIADPERASALARAARAKVEAEYDLRRNASLLLARFATVHPSSLREVVKC